MMFLMVVLILERANRIANVLIAKSQGMGRLILASQQLQECIEKNNPYNPQNQWMPGMLAQNLMHQADPCADQRQEVEELMNQSAAGGNKVATSELGGAPAPQLATAGDPTPNTDPAIALNEFVVPSPDMQNNWSPVNAADVWNEWMKEWEERGGGEIPEDMEDDLLLPMFHLELWCPWWIPEARKSRKWKLKYHPRNDAWMGRWKP
nr:nonstructural protein 2 NS2 [Chaphamaparvovirus anseriform 8]